MQPGEEIIGGRYRRLAEIGRGGMAVVYLAEQLDVGNRRVALKQLGRLQTGDPEASSRFLMESRIMGQLNHPNIVTVHDFFEHEGVAYIVMEYLPRGSLLPLVGRLTVPQVAGVLEGILAALSYAAGHGVVHRDLKPANVMIAGNGSVKVADFGVARALNGATRITSTGMVVGTPAYMAPEQALGKEVSPRTDLYTTGVMAYEMLVGRTPFTTADSPMALLYKHATESPPAPDELAPDIDLELADWLLWMLEKDPERRPADAEEAWDALEERILRLCGPRWRREARLPVQGAPDGGAPLTPAPFSTRTPSTGGDRFPAAPTATGAVAAHPTPAPTIPPMPAAEIPATAPPIPRATPQTQAAAPPPAPPPPTVPGGPQPREGEPPDPRSRTNRRLLVGGLGIAGAILVAGGVTVLVGGDDESTSAGTTSTAAPGVVTPATDPDPVRPVAAGGGTSLVLANPSGVVQELGGGRVRVSATHASRPRSAVTAGNLVAVGDRRGVTWLERGTLAARAAGDVGGEVVDLARAGGVTWAAVQVPGGGGRVCAVYVERAPACTALTFAPAGVATSPAGLLVTDTAGGQLVRFTGAGGSLRTAKAIDTLQAPGAVVAVGGRAFVAVSGGLQVIDPTSGETLAAHPLSGTPSDLAATGGRLTAAIPLSGAVAVMSTSAVTKAPTENTLGGSPQSVVPRDARRVYVVDGTRGRVRTVDARTGKPVGGATRFPVGGRARRAPVLQAVTVSTAGRTTTIRVAVAGGIVQPRDLRVPDDAISDGAAGVTVWQGGITSGLAAGRRAGDARLRVTRGYGRVSLGLSAGRGVYRSMTTRITRGGRTVEITLTKPAPVSRPTPTVPRPTTPVVPPTPEPRQPVAPAPPPTRTDPL